MVQTLQTIAEMAPFIKFAAKYLSDDDLDRLKIELAGNPQAGAIMRGTGGVRKYRFAPGATGRGKSGGTRIIYYFHNRNRPIFLITGFPKNEKINLTEAEKAKIKALTALLSK